MHMRECAHFVSMNGEGKVFDPYPRYPGYYGRDTLDHPDFAGPPRRDVLPMKSRR